MKINTTVILALAASFTASSAAAQTPSGVPVNSSTRANASASAQASKSEAQASGSAGASSATQAGQSSTNLSDGTALNAALSKPVDAKKNKAGDAIAAKTTQSTKSDNGFVIPKGSTLVGHVTEAKARANGESESSLGIVFDKAVLKNGQEVPLNATVRALAASSASSSAADLSSGADDFSGAAATAGSVTSRTSGGALGGARSTTGVVTNTAASAGGVANGTTRGALNSTTNVAGASHGAVGGLDSAGRLTSHSQGVFGLKGLNLNATASNGTQGSVITSTGKNVHLDSGTQVLLTAHGQPGASAEKQ